MPTAKLAKRLAKSWQGGSGRGRGDADMVEEKLEEEERGGGGGRRRRRRRRTALIKSNNPHLAYHGNCKRVMIIPFHPVLSGYLSF